MKNQLSVKLAHSQPFKAKMKALFDRNFWLMRMLPKDPPKLNLIREDGERIQDV